MVIDSNNNLNSASNLRTRTDSGAQAKSSTNQGNSPASTTSGTDKLQPEVSISSEAKTLSRLASDIQSSPDVDNDRVAALKKAIEDGSYSVNADRIAEKMLDQDTLF